MLGELGKFGGWGSWVKYGANMEGVEECIGVWGEVREGVLGVWEVCWDGGRCVEVCLGCGEMCLGRGERCEKNVGVGAMWGCLEVWGEMWNNLGERENMGRRVVSRFGTPTLLTPTLQPKPPDHNSPDP